MLGRYGKRASPRAWQTLSSEVGDEAYRINEVAAMGFKVRRVGREREGTTLMVSRRKDQAGGYGGPGGQTVWKGLRHSLTWYGCLIHHSVGI